MMVAVMFMSIVRVLTNAAQLYDEWPVLRTGSSLRVWLHDAVIMQLRQEYINSRDLLKPLSEPAELNEFFFA